MIFCYFLFIDFDMKYTDRELMDTQLHHFDHLIRHSSATLYSDPIFDYCLFLSIYLLMHQR